ncbi:helix-turn-helix domain-containing protein [Pseudomonas sp. GG8]
MTDEEFDRDYLTIEAMAIRQFTPEHCVEARQQLGWSHEALAAASGVSVTAIQRFEAKEKLLDVTRLALAFRLEGEGLIFLPGISPMRGENVKGPSPDPRTRNDFAMIE